FNFQSQGVSSFVAYLSFGLRKFESTPPPPPPPEYGPPTVNCSITPDSVMKGQGSQTFTITSQARDPENDIVTYSWSASGGATVSGTGSSVTVDATSLSAGSYTVTETVSDGRSEERRVGKECRCRWAPCD